MEDFLGEGMALNLQWRGASAPAFASGGDAGDEVRALRRPASQAVFLLEAQELSQGGKYRQPAGKDTIGVHGAAPPLSPIPPGVALPFRKVFVGWGWELTWW